MHIESQGSTLNIVIHRIENGHVLQTFFQYFREKIIITTRHTMLTLELKSTVNGTKLGMAKDKT